VRIADYLAKFQQGQPVTLPDSKGDEPIVLQAADEDRPDAGPDMLLGSDAAEAVELHRALTAWLTDHKQLHPGWHRRYRQTNPGGPWDPQTLARAGRAARR
jgi:hypothetical protein